MREHIKTNFAGKVMRIGENDLPFVMLLFQLYWMQCHL